MKIKTYNRGALYNFTHSIKVTLSPRVPKHKRQTLKAIRERRAQQRRDSFINRK